MECSGSGLEPMLNMTTWSANLGESTGQLKKIKATRLIDHSG